MMGAVEPEPGPAGPPTRTYAARRLTALTLAVALVVLAAAGVRGLLGGDGPRPNLEAWVPYWALDDSLAQIRRHGDEFQTVSPFWYRTTSATTIEADPNLNADHGAQFIQYARASGVKVLPSILDGTSAGTMATILADPAARTSHVETLRSLAETNGFDGLDLDYEQFAFADDRSTWTTTRPAWIAFVEELADALHADGRSLTVSVPPVYDDGQSSESGYWVYDYGAMSEHVDRIRIMAYDYSTAVPGPIAPTEFVKEAVRGAKAATRGDGKLSLGIPLYGYNWVISTTGVCPPQAETGRSTVTQRNLADLISKRSAVPVYDEANGEWSFTYVLEVTDGTSTCSQTREVHYVDAAGAVDRVEIAQQAGLDAVSLWAFGYDDEAFWTEWDAD